MKTEYSLKNLLEIIFESTNKNACILADSYLLKDISTISRWRNGKTLPKHDDIDKVIEFTIKESTVSQRMIIRTRIESLLIDSSLSEELKRTIIRNDDFSDFLRDSLSISISSQTTNKFKGIRKVLSDKLLDNKDRFIGSLDFDVSIEKDGTVRPNGPIKLRHRFMGGYGKLLPKSSTLSFIFIILAAFILYTIKIPRNNSSNIAIKATPSPTLANSLILANAPVVTPTASPCFTSPTPQPENSNNDNQNSIVETKKATKDNIDDKTQPKAGTKTGNKAKIKVENQTENQTELSSKETNKAHNITGDKNVVLDQVSNSSISISIN